jgi:pimeloyl-ACP methyl ester carboxylesterase
MITESRLSIAGLGVPCLSAGPAGAAEAALFVHGNPGSSEDWRDLVGRVGAFGRAVALDLPGFGRADKPPDFDYSVPGYARFLEAARRELGLTRLHLVVHDFGGPFAMEWAGQHLELVASFTVINAPPAQDYRWYLLAHAWQTPLLGELVQLSLVRPIFRQVAGRGHPSGLPPGFLDRMYDDYDDGTRQAVLKLYRATDARRMVSTPAERFAAADIPALVVWATEDVYMPIQFAYVHRAAFPSAEVVELPERGHFVLAEDPEAVAALVLPFLRQHWAAPAAT